MGQGGGTAHGRAHRLAIRAGHGGPWPRSQAKRKHQGRPSGQVLSRCVAWPMGRSNRRSPALTCRRASRRAENCTCWSRPQALGHCTGDHCGDRPPKAGCVQKRRGLGGWPGPARLKLLRPTPRNKDSAGPAPVHREFSDWRISLQAVHRRVGVPVLHCPQLQEQRCARRFSISKNPGDRPGQPCATTAVNPPAAADQASHRHQRTTPVVDQQRPVVTVYCDGQHYPPFLSTPGESRSRLPLIRSLIELTG